MSGKELTTSKKHIDWIDILKGIAIILVVIGHIYTNSAVYNWFYSFHLPLFFFASGYVYKKKDIMNDIIRRTQTLIVPYFLFGILELFYWQFIERRFRTSDLSFGQAIIGLLRGQYGTLDFNVHLWFLPCFFVSVILYNILNNFGGKKMAFSFTLVIMLIFVILPLPIQNWPVWESNLDWVDWNGLPALPWGFNRVFRYFPFIALGSLFAEKDTFINKCFNNKKSLSIITAIAAFICSYWVSNLMLNRTGILWFVTALMGIYGTLIISKVIDHNRLLQYLGRISLVILCVHGPIYRVILKLMSLILNISVNFIRANFVASILAVLITLLISAVIFEIIVRITPWMIGRKK